MSEKPVVLGGRYELGHVIGRGGMAEVYLATDTRLHRTVAVKVLRSDLARDDSFQERFRREAQSAAGLNHPAIVSVYDTGEDHRTERGHEISIPYIVMEYVEGRTLRAFIHEDRPMEMRQAAEIMAGVLSALEYSHERGIVHRDIKPGNIMITEHGAVKVMDFGIARAVADATSAMTQTQAVMGTAQYLSPEQARGQLVDARSDIYSAACVLYEMLTGRPPFTGDSPVSIAYQHVRENPVPPSTYNPTIPPPMDAVILTGLAKDRDERYPSAVAFSRDIAAVVAGRPPQLVAGGTLTGADGQTTTVLSPVGATQVLPEGETQLIPTQGGHAVAPVASAPAPTGPGATPPGDDAAEKRHRRPVWLFVLIILAVLAIAAAALAYFNPFGGADTATVPDLVGDTQAEASAKLKDAGLKPAFTPKADADVEKGRVISTDPTSGKEVATASTVTVVVSSGPGTVDVPDLTGKTPDEAEQILDAQGLGLKVVDSEDSKDVDKGQITRSKPAAGTTASEGDTIEVWTASGDVTVPAVVDMKKDDAVKAIEEAGLKAEVTEAESDTVDPDTVTSQNPASDGTQTAEKGSTVQIVVATAPGPVTVPNLTGQTADAAATKLGDLGLGVKRTTEHSSDVPKGSVIRTDPEANSPVDAGSTVTIVVSDGPEPTPTTSAPASPTESTSPTPTETGTPTDEDQPQG
ncbi:Stk1 family PASTA domain-containing Ser/Thr kinase [Brachybacterium huguangmaarense]|uniref:non-specific serine/threonine protein kinase n=1 Tax=Brachybacterium huguangmaarense TaxID=1652028 RepID=A0ABY6G450_9MICO|nr:Stk1 family PASTA domain-containing Ser/Thr kinase [Brachybacterium huguangmaarense]UYG17897.1 Stk1 family PASTA domain-containing Ser/Thr kinase [Brachybacterium huguangmaarense]